MTRTLIALLLLQTALAQSACIPTFNTFPLDATRECDGSGSLWYPLDTGTPTGSCDCDGTISSATIIDFNMDPTNNPTGVLKPEIVDVVNSLCGLEDEGLGRFTRRWVAECSDGIFITQDQVITITDTTPPVIGGPVVVQTQCLRPLSFGSTDGFQHPGCSDACDHSPQIFRTAFTTEDAVCPSMQTVNHEWTCVDACGNIAMFNQLQTFTDNQAPGIQIAIPDPDVCEPGCCEDLTGNSPLLPPCASGTASATDECDARVDSAILTYVDSTEQLSGSDTLVTRNWTVADCAGNVGVYIQQFAVEVDVIYNSLVDELTNGDMVTIPLECTPSPSSTSPPSISASPSQSPTPSYRLEAPFLDFASSCASQQCTGLNTNIIQQGAAFSRKIGFRLDFNFLSENKDPNSPPCSETISILDQNFNVIPSCKRYMMDVFPTVVEDIETGAGAPFITVLVVDEAPLSAPQQMVPWLAYAGNTFPNPVLGERRFASQYNCTPYGNQAFVLVWQPEFCWNDPDFGQELCEFPRPETGFTRDIPDNWDIAGNHFVQTDGSEFPTDISLLWQIVQCQVAEV